ncbi:MAG: DUF2497 domain-containing protein [Proteobacteria bacterium]|nr:DUF2497 domain-containing protein [Pseudomonadota bacterium]
MSDEKTEQEPSMEEILASIRRIISDDDEIEQPPKEASGTRSDDVLELTQMVSENGSTIDLTAQAAEPGSEPGQAPEIEPATPSEPEQAAEPEPATAEPAEPEPAAAEPVISGAAASASVEAFSKLAQAAEPALGDASGSSEGTQSVEDLVTEMLRPMLRDWLDRNLPAIVERIVQKEIRRLVRQAEPD